MVVGIAMCATVRAPDCLIPGRILCLSGRSRDFNYSLRKFLQSKRDLKCWSYLSHGPRPISGIDKVGANSRNDGQRENFRSDIALAFALKAQTVL